MNKTETYYFTETNGHEKVTYIIGKLSAKTSICLSKFSLHLSIYFKPNNICI